MSRLLSTIGRVPILLQPDRITAADRAASYHGRIDANIDLIVLGRGSQNPWVLWQVALGEGRHDAARAGASDAQAHLVTDGERVADPRIFDEVLNAVGGLHDDVRPEAPHLEPPLRIQL